MGKGVFLLLGAAMFGATALMYGAKQSAFESEEQQSEYEYTVVARDIAESGHDEALSAIRRQLMASKGTQQDVGMLGGAYDRVIAENTYGDLDVEVEGVYRDARHRLRSNVIFVASQPAALALSDDEVDADASGSTFVSGMDRRAPSRGSGSGFTRPVRALLTDDLHAQSVREAFTNAQAVGEGNEDGTADQPSVYGGVEKDVYEALYQEALPRADLRIDSSLGVDSRIALLRGAAATSSPGQPVIVRALGDLLITQPVQGHGLLIVEDGDLNVASDGFNWEGMVLMRKTQVDTTRIHLRNDARVHGSLASYSLGGGGTVDDCAADFEIDGNRTVVQDSFRVKITVLGAAISYGGQYDMPVTTKIMMDGQTYQPFGPWDNPITGNVNTGNSGATYTWEPDEVFPPGTSLRVDGRSWRKRSSRYSGNRTSHWRTHMRKDSDTVDDQLAVLRDDDSVPNVGGYMGQNSAEEFVAEYIDMDARRMTMDAGQSIYLFELGMN
ncbi:MAG: hypothetical protein R3247_17050, partial [Rhodothermales bacterium]|nr:hypothetical protein [Rhodothermales bacterium]